MRTIVDIPERERGALDALARRRGVSRAELVRQAIAAYLEQVQVGEDRVFGMWKDRSEDSIEYQRRIRDEWQRD